MDGDSLEFHRFIHERGQLIDKAWGAAVHCALIGNPLDHGENYERLGGKMRARLDNAGAIRYQALVKSRGTELNHLLREMDRLREMLGVRSDRLPAIALRTTPDTRPCLLLHIKRDWLSSESAKLTLSRALQECLSEQRVRALVEPGRTTVARLRKRAQLLLDEITARLRQRAQPDTVTTSPTGEAGRKVMMVIDTSTHCATYQGKQLELSNQEFRILCELARTAKQGSGWVARTRLEGLLWKDQVETGDYPDRRKLDYPIARLRTALRRVSGLAKRKTKSLIETKRHVGFRLNLPPEHIRLN